MKKIISLFLVLVLTFSCCGISAFADDSTDKSTDDTEPLRYSYIDSVGAYIEKELLGFVYCDSSFSMLMSGYTVTLTCYLQRTDGTTGWVNYKSKSQSFSSGGGHVIDETWFAPSGYTYRTYTKAVVKNSKGTTLETATVVSDLLYK